jgi:ABC-type Co2+ transport system permease subunit
MLAPLQLIDDFLLNYNVGQAVLLLFVLSLPAGYVQGSRKITALNLALFGVLFMAVPSIGGGPSHYVLLGIALLVTGPMLYATAER